MKITYAAFFAALILATLAMGAYAAGATYPGQQCASYSGHYYPNQYPTNQSPGYDRSPIPVIVGQACGAGPVCACVDPWVSCGAFCTAGQLPAGWPYGWRDDYWLRPDSNF